MKVFRTISRVSKVKKGKFTLRQRFAALKSKVGCMIDILAKKIKFLRIRVFQLSLKVKQTRKSLNKLKSKVGMFIDPLAEQIALLNSLKGQQVTIETDAGMVTGFITAVGTNYVQLQELDGNLVLLPVFQINSVG